MGNMNLLNYLFLAVVEGTYQMTSDMADRLLQNGISGSQCGDPDYPYLPRVRPMPALPDRIIKDRWSGPKRPSPKRRSEILTKLFGQMKPQQMIPVKIDGGRAIYG